MNIKKILNEHIGNIYENQILNQLNDNHKSLIKVFRDFNKLSWNLTEDVKYIANLNKQLSENDEFDPFSHLKDTGKIEVENDCILTISKPNSKLEQIFAPSLSLPAGYTCPFADTCKSLARKPNVSKSVDAIRDFGDIRCFAASDEMLYPNLKRMRWRNFDLILDVHKKSGIEGVVLLLLKSLENYERKNGVIKIFRIHDSGDFFLQWYLDAWVETAKSRPDVLFYAYTKSLPFWEKIKDNVPKNLRLIASEGGKADELIDKNNFRKAVIVKDKAEAIKRELKIDVNDFLAAFGDEDFALLMHGVQSKESQNTRQAKQNSKTIKDVASKFKVNPTHIKKID
jgi:Gene product 88